MAIGTLMPVAEYLDTVYKPDCDYVDGEVVERNVGELSHGILQLNVASWLKARAGQLRFQAATEVRLRITALDATLSLRSGSTLRTT